jgi:glutathione S-transferase
MEEPILDKFGFLAVDDNSYYAQSIKLSLEQSLGVEVKCIQNGRYSHSTVLEVERIYSEGKYPVIVLDEQLGEHTSGTDIMKYLVERYEQGGILLASDTLYRMTQLWKWESIMQEKKESKWLVGNYNGVGQIGEMCTEFMNNLHNREQSIELRNR